MSGRYRSLSGAMIDPEKARNSNDSDMAPSLAGMDEPMLGDSPPGKKYAMRYHLPRRRFSRYFTLAIASLLFLFAFYLLKSSWSSEAQVRLGLSKPSSSPQPWEEFPFLKRYHGGLRSLVPKSENVPEFPGKDEEDVAVLQAAAEARKQKEDKATADKEGFAKRDGGGRSVVTSSRFDPFADAKASGKGQKVHCYLNDETKTDAPQLLAYNGIPKGFPEPAMGSHELFGLRNDVCFDRYGRLGPYGFGYSRRHGGTGAGMEGDREGVDSVWGGQMEVDYRKVQWGDAQKKCMEANAHRFRSAPKGLNHFFQAMGPGGPRKDAIEDEAENGQGKMNRTAVIIRTWADYNYDPEDLLYLRAIVNELSIQSGTEYVVHFLVHVHDDNLQIWSDEETYQRTLDDALPEEFRGMGTLWSERQMGLIYGGVHESFYRDLPVHGAYRSTYMPMQYFAHMHPEYDFFWHWEMDARYTGHFYHLFNKVSEWARKQPRKELWERNGRFYVPAEHGSWEDFKQLVKYQTHHGTARKDSMYEKLAADAGSKHPLDEVSRKASKSIWGPEHPVGKGNSIVDEDDDPKAPSYDDDNYEWGVDEEADFITFNPLFDPHNTNWILAEDVTGYNTTEAYPPRRTAIITASRLSRRLLETMHRETSLKRHTMFSEMWPGSCALQHGYKAVYAPHPVYIDRRWPTSYMAAIFNNGLHGAAGGSRLSVFSDERQHNFKGTTWYYEAGFSPNLWKRWLGFRVDNDGGEEEEMANEGRMCLPAMLLHPVKQVDLVFEHKAD